MLRLNGAEAAPSTVVYAGDSIEFVPAVSGAPAQRTLKDLLGADFTGGVTINGRLADLETRLELILLREGGDFIVVARQGHPALVHAQLLGHQLPQAQQWKPRGWRSPA